MTDYNTKITEIEDKIHDTSSFVKKTDYNTKITEIEEKIADTSNLATKTALTTLENKIPNISNLATKTALNTVENKIPDINSLVKKIDYNIEIGGIKLNINKLQVHDLSYFKGKQYFDEGSGKHNYLVFLPMRKYFKLNSVAGVTDYVLSWQSKGLSNASIKPPTTSNNSLNPRLSYYGTKVKVQFKKSCLKQSNNIFTHKNIVNTYIVYELPACSSHTSDPIIKSCLFGAVTLTKNADIEKYKYSGYGIGFNRRSSFSFPRGGFGQNVLIFGADMSSSIHIDSKKKDILVLGRGPMQGLEITLTAAKKYSINSTVTKNKFCLSLHYNEANIYLFVNGTEICKFKAKDSEIVASPLCLRNISKDWSTDNIKETGLASYVYDFSEITMLLQLMILKIFTII